MCWGNSPPKALVELRRNRGAAVATPSWDEARDVFDVRLGLERLIVSRLAGRLTAEQIKQLESHVDDEEQARGTNEPLSIRLATEFHIVLAEMTGSPVLTRYVSEVASRCGLILALYSRPHSAECAVSEHRAVIAALAAGDAERATAVMDEHLEAVAGRALIVSRPPREYDIKAILARYANDAPASLRRQAARAPSGRLLSRAGTLVRVPRVTRTRPRSRPWSGGRSALSFQTSICTILPSRTTKAVDVTVAFERMVPSGHSP
jgi:hypothetical protein